MDALDKAVKAAGGVTSLADSLGVGQNVVSNWRKRGRVPPSRVIKIEGVTGVSRHELRPDVFGPAAGHAVCPDPPITQVLITKRALRARLGLATDAHLAKVLQLPVEQVEAWPEDQSVPALPQVMKLLGVQEQAPAVAAPEDPDAGRIDLDVHAA
ncbi:transcriptional regulator [Stenotrophomonas sp. NPDC077421]|uniref:transcriptional regulator n=1 Tax=Stenotrophomonas sp. NPDC077421 TaxID=3414699 RepID=UPI003C2C74F0